MTTPVPDDPASPTYTLAHLTDDEIDVMLHELQVVEELKQEAAHE